MLFLYINFNLFMLFLFKYNLCLETLFPFILSAVPTRFKYVRMHALETFPLKCFSEVTTRFKCRQNACFRKIVFKMFSAVPNRYKYLQNTRFRGIMFILSAVPNRFKYVRMHDLETFFSFLFSAVPNRHTRQNACFRDIVFKLFSELTNLFK